MLNEKGDLEVKVIAGKLCCCLLILDTHIPFHYQSEKEGQRKASPSNTKAIPVCCQGDGIVWSGHAAAHCLSRMANLALLCCVCAKVSLVLDSINCLYIYQNVRNHLNW